MEIEWEDSKEPTSAGNDETLENDLILLLSKLERWVAALQDSKTKNRPLDVLESLGDLANQVVEFKESSRHRFSISLEQALRTAASSHPQTGNLEIEEERLSTRRASAMYRNWADDLEDRKPMFAQTCRATIRVLGCYFSAFAEAFVSPEPRKRWQETASVFVLDLLRVIDRVPF